MQNAQDFDFDYFEDQLFQKYSEKLNRKSKNIPASFKAIPQFYFKLPKNSDSLMQKLREESRTLFLQKRSRELLDNGELKELWSILEKNYTKPLIGDEQFINYDDYKTVVLIVSEKCRYVNHKKTQLTFINNV